MNTRRSSRIGFSLVLVCGLALPSVGWGEPPATPPASAPQTKPVEPAKAPETKVPETKSEPKTTEKPQTPAKPADSTTADKKAEPAKEQFVRVSLETSLGEIVLELNNEKAPLSTANFLNYVAKGHYNGTVFHRVIGNFMIQGGGFDEAGKQKPTDAGVKNEWKNGLKNTKGSIAMARLGNQPDSGTAQFFINVQDNPFLDEPRDGAGYAVFGKVVSGLDVIEKIKAVKTTTKQGMGDWPVENVVIKTAKKLEK
jgi:peptidyl-prolyl cis-trans isomerase A (cyclophilin A)